MLLSLQQTEYQLLLREEDAAPSRSSGVEELEGYFAARLPYAPAFNLGMILSPADAGQGESGLSLSWSQTLYNANVGPQDGPPKIGLKTANLLA